MPDWQPDWSDVSFAHAEATEAAEACRTAARRLGGLGGRRDDMAGDVVLEWSGRYRDDFDRALIRHRRWTERLIERLLAQATRIDAAAADATRIQGDRDGDRTRYREEVRAEEDAAAAIEPAER